MALQTLSQERARHAWSQVEAAVRKYGADFEEQIVDPGLRVPNRIRTSGLGQTVAYMQSKQEALDILEALADWLFQRRLIPSASPQDLLGEFRKGSAATLRLLTAEALAYLEWYVRFARSRL